MRYSKQNPEQITVNTSGKAFISGEIFSTQNLRALISYLFHKKTQNSSRSDWPQLLPIIKREIRSSHTTLTSVLILRVGHVISGLTTALASGRVAVALAGGQGAGGVMLALGQRVRLAALLGAVLPARHDARVHPKPPGRWREAPVAAEAAKPTARQEVLGRDVGLHFAARVDADAVRHRLDSPKGLEGEQKGRVELKPTELSQLQDYSPSRSRSCSDLGSRRSSGSWTTSGGSRSCRGCPQSCRGTATPSRAAAARVASAERPAAFGSKLRPWSAWSGPLATWCVPRCWWNGWVGRTGPGIRGGAAAGSSRLELGCPQRRRRWRGEPRRATFWRKREIFLLPYDSSSSFDEEIGFRSSCLKFRARPSKEGDCGLLILEVSVVARTVARIQVTAEMRVLLERPGLSHYLGFPELEVLVTL